MKKVKVKGLILFVLLISLFLTNLSSFAWGSNFLSSDSHLLLRAKADSSLLKVSKLSEERKKKEEDPKSKSMKPEIFIIMVYLLTVGASVAGILIFYYLRERMFE